MKMPQAIRKTFLVGLLMAIVVPAALAQQDNPKPAWLNVKPRDTDSLMYFIGLGQSPIGNLTEASEYAGEDIQFQIVKFVGVQITATSTLEAKGSLDEFKASISKQVKLVSSARTAGFRVEDTWSLADGKALNYYIFASYEKEALLKEKQRLQELFTTQVDAVRIPEQAGGKLSADGRYYEAALRFIEAAVAANESTLEDHDIALNRNLANAMAALEKINLIKLNDNLSGVTGAQPEAAFRLKAAGGPAADAKGVPKTGILITYFVAPAAGNSPLAKSVSQKTDDDGLLEFRHPALTFVGGGKVLMRLDLDAYLDKLKPIGKKYGEKVDALTRLALSKKQEFAVTALAPAKSLPLAVVVTDVDENGKPLPANQATASGIRESLTQQGFKLKTAALDPALTVDADEETLSALILAKAAGAERAVVGTASLDSVAEDQGRFVITVAGTVKVLDLKAKKVIYEKSMQKKYVGNSLESGKAGAFKLLGKELGLRIAAEVK